MKKATGMLIALALFLGAALPATAKSKDMIYNLMIRYEAHTAEDPPGTNAGLNDDYAYTVFSATKKLTPHTLLSGFYSFRAGMESEARNANLLGLTYMVNYKYYKLSAGYSFSDNDTSDEKIDADRLSFSVSNTFNPTQHSNIALTMTNSYSTRTDWDTEQTWNCKLALPYKAGKTTTGTVSYTYGYSFDRSGKVYNQYNAVVTQSLSKRDKLSLDYLFVQRADSYVIRGSNYEPDDDNVIRVTWSRTL